MSDEKKVTFSRHKDLKEPGTKHKRIKFVCLGYKDILEQTMAIFNKKPSFQIRGLPDDVDVIAVHLDQLRHSFILHCCSMEWPIHGSSAYIPELAEIEMVQPPSEDHEFVLWRKVCAALSDERQQGIRSEDALSVVEGGIDEAN